MKKEADRQNSIQALYFGDDWLDVVSSLPMQETFSKYGPAGYRNDESSIRLAYDNTW